MSEMRSNARKVGDVSVEAGRFLGQSKWYEFAASMFQGKRVLDAGCGLGKGLPILRRTNAVVMGQDSTLDWPVKKY